MTDGAAFTERELDVMSHLWAQGSGTVAEVRDSLHDAPTYTGVLKLLQILEEKGMVRHEQEGRAYRYYPVVAREAAEGPALRRVVDRLFQGSAELTLARLVSEGDLDREVLERMRRLLDKAMGEADR
ncbi:MAG: BlaI/MecI/CopY family transcriptional regulator [Longimicrobiales bacterium]|nr:BlaI/MecI/CopY family transcriptional regulator [Longimicrobiales bacterium]